MTVESRLPPRFARVCIPSWGLRRIPHLETFLPEAGRILPPLAGRSCEAVAGWGRKKTSIRARALAAARGVPYLALEDGFLRSFGLGVDGAPPLSLVVDYSGIYYDSSAPSDLETLLETGVFDTELLDRARRAMDWLRHEKLTKYNKGLQPYDGPPIRRLIVDQTENDASVLLSGADGGAFERMIADALAAHEAASVAVKLHPDTLRGKKGGYLRGLALRHGLRLIETPVNPWDLFAQADEVATISSQLGFEAVMAGKKVHCHGLPFYAGWGLTEDSLACPRRTRKRSAEEVFAAAYLSYARYADPFTGAPATLEDTIGLLSDLRRHEARTQGAFVALGFSPWKKHFIRHFTGGGVRFARKAKPGGRLLVWAARHERLVREGALPPSAPVTRMEDGFVRSRGLGALLARPWSLVLDRSGIYYDPRAASDLETLLQNETVPACGLSRARAVRAALCENRISKYNTGGGSVLWPGAAEGRKVVLVPGQVEDDASILAGTAEGGVRTNTGLLSAVRAANPEAFVVYKPHPDVEAGRRRGAVEGDLLARSCDMVVRGGNIADLWPRVDEVHTLTSLSGFEALLREKDVYVYGRPFYAGWGLTRDSHVFPRRTRRLALDELVYGALILYPLYFDWQSGGFCNIETVIHRLASGKSKNKR